MTNFYNEYDADCVAALRLEMARGRIPEGTVDDRSIEQVASADLVGFRHCHFFAGAGGSALACKLAEWPDDRELWCGGFPCTGISAAGKGKGLEDQQSRLWWAWLGLIAARRPLRVLIENSPMLRTRGYDRVAASLEGIGYACRPVVVGAKHAGSPQKRLRVWVVCRLADDQGDGTGPRRLNEDWRPAKRGEAGTSDIGRGATSGLANADGEPNDAERANATRQQREPSDASSTSRLVNPEGERDGSGRLRVGIESAIAVAPSGSERGGRADSDGLREPQPHGSLEQGWRRLSNGRHECRWPAPRLVDADGNTLPSPQYEWEPPRSLERGMGRGADGLSVRLGRRRNKARIKQLGNAWCPQAAAAVLRAWMVAEDVEAASP